MKKVLIGLAALVVIVVGVIAANVIIRESTAEKAGDLVYKIFSELDIYDWDYKSASLMGNTLIVKELVLEDEVLIKELKLSNIKEETDQISANISIKGLDVTEDHSKYFRVDRIKIKDFVLAVRQYDDPMFRSFSDFEIHNLRSRSYGEGFNIESINFKGKFSMPFDSLDLEEMVYWAANFDYSDHVYELAELEYDFKVKNFSVIIDSWSKPFEIQSVTATSKIKGKNLVQDFKAEAKDFFTITADSLSTFIAEGKEVHVADMEVVNMNLAYVDKGLIEFFFNMLEDFDPDARAEAANELREHGAAFMGYAIENAEVFANQLADFILKPEKITLTSTPAEPIPYIDLLEYMNAPGSMFSMLNMNIAFNNNEAFPLIFTAAFLEEIDSLYENNYGYDYYDYDYDRTIAGQVVNFVSYDWDYDVCTFTGVYTDDDGSFDLYCSEGAGDFFERNDGPFYIEYNIENYVTYYDVDYGEYEDWYDGYDYDDYDYDDYYDYDYEEPIAGFHMNYIRATDSDMDFPPNFCHFTAVDNSDYTVKLYCDEYDIDFFQSEAGPFFVEFSDEDVITGYDTDPTGELYEDWDDRG